MKYVVFSSLFILLFIQCKKENIENNKTSLNSYYEKAWEFRDENRLDSAYYYFNLSKDKATEKKDSLVLGKSLLNLGILECNKGNHFDSHQSNISALKYLPPTDSSYLTSVFNCNAISYIELKNYKEAIYWLKKAIIHSNETYDKLSLNNNLAVTYFKLKNYSKSVKVLDSISKEKILEQYPELKAKIIDNLAFTKWKQNSNYNPTPELKKALKIRLKENDLWGQNASYAHFSDYYRKTNPQKALFYANKMYEIAKKLNSPDDQLEAIQKLIALETPEKSKFFFNRYVNLNDSIQNVRNQTKNKFALIKYDAEKNRSDNLKLKAENVEKDLQVFRSKVWLYVLAGLILIGLISSYLGYLLFKRKAKQKEIESVHNTELRLAKKVHDSVANKAHQLLVETDHLISNPTEKESIKEKLIHLYELSRNISRETYDFDTNENFSHDLIEMLLSYETEDIKVLTNPIQSEFWEEIASHKKIVCYRVLQELMTNMRKHSKANYVEITISKRKNSLAVDYFDDGIGLHATKLKYKNGLRNTETRIKDIQGKIKFEQDLKEEGTHISFNFPIK